ncbi:Cystathionine gamma-synthase [Anaeromyxobacter dehalogenans 2CP-1]|uniref:Cystathionine gamma-synthase n=1 Tax=Anaeromyxobacter dehalogenans (strain ATCC BAA-258 / DSM 21875 / 2CP-1) TaxID=455488 RepID=B8JHF5_ANAD2|nr:PLP-dependent aspartate aminotransferase family protein [Anaeromyxobacter dehalogenans]ACL66667.1 Cystathionine gamma-synthase [Anaeromyxobacter dehalogenans 2CP-1]
MSEDVHLDSNVPGNPAYHFTIVAPGTPARAGWAERAPLVPGAALATQCVHAGVQPDPAYGAVMPPIYQSSTFAFRDVCTNAGYDYTRSGNPTRAALEEAIATLEGGAGATCTTTGMAAVLVALNLLPHGSHLLCTVDCYGGTFRTLEHARQAYGLEVTYLDLADLGAVERALRPNTGMVWIETPSNPLLRLTDIRAVAELAHRRGALVVVDNTFLSPALQRPFEHGADLVVHSTTKYLNGHSDVVGGAVVAPRGRTALLQRIQSMNNLLGTSQSPHDAFLVLRGLKTLALRVKAHEAGAQRVAEFLAGHPQVARVHYPGLPSHPQHALARAQQRGFGAMLSFELRDGRPDRVDHVLRTLRWFTLAESLGGVESLVAHPASMTHASMTPEARQRAGITDSVIRLSIGIEDPADLIGDLDRALASLPA